jgi:hypothetical protein
MSLTDYNGGSMDNKDCTCKFDEHGDLEESNPGCPVQGHRYSLLAVTDITVEVK